MTSANAGARRFLGYVAVVAGVVLAITAACSRGAPVDTVPITGEVPKTPTRTMVATASVLIEESPELPTPPVEALRISPNSVVADPGETVQLSVEAFGPQGRRLSDVEFVWTVVDARAGYIDGDGMLQIGTRPGVFEDTISVTGIQNTPNGIGYVNALASITVVGDPQTPRLASVVFIPQTPTLLEQQIVRLRAVGFDDSGLVIPGVSFVWEVNDPTLGRINEIGYLTVEGHEGEYEGAVSVVGIWEGYRASAQTDVRVVATNNSADLLNVHALPQRFFLGPGDRLHLSAVALNGLGELVAGTQLRWAMEDPRAGSIDGSGNFIAGNASGIFTEAVKVEAVVPGESGFAHAVDFASVVIREERSSGRLNAVTVAPQTIVLAPGGRATVIVSAVDQSGKPADDVDISWEVLSERAGEISALGSFKAGTAPGRYKEALRVNVEQQDGDEVTTMSRTVDVVITGTLSKTDVQPTLAVVSPGRTIHFSITGFDENGVALPGLVAIWKVQDETIGTIDAFGNFTAGGSPGMYEDVIQVRVVQTLPEGR